MIYGELNHPSLHHHKLTLVNEERPYTCDRCFQYGFYTRYKCPSSRCNFHLHKDCAHTIYKPKVTHPFYPNCIFHFCQSPVSAKQFCDACGLNIKGYNYHCYEKDLDLHPSCTKLPMKARDGYVMLELKKKVYAKCCRCRQMSIKNNRESWSYVSTCKEFHFHPACVEEMLIEKWEMKYLGRHHRGGDTGKGKEKASDGAKALVVTREKPKLLHVVPHDDRRRRSGSYVRYVKVVASFIIAALGGNPVSLVLGLVSAIFSD